MFQAEGIASVRALRQGHAWRVRGTSRGQSGWMEGSKRDEVREGIE